MYESLSVDDAAPSISADDATTPMPSTDGTGAMTASSSHEALYDDNDDAASKPPYRQHPPHVTLLSTYQHAAQYEVRYPHYAAQEEYMPPPECVLRNPWFWVVAIVFVGLIVLIATSK